MVLDNLNPFVKKGNKNKEIEYAIYYYNYLFTMAMSLYEWKNLPETCNRDYLEWCLLTQGQATFIPDNKKELRSLGCSRVGIDPYNFPTNIISSNPVLGTLEGKVNKDCVWVRNNKLVQPSINLISHYAGQMAKIQTSLDISLVNNRMTKIFYAENEEQAQQLKKMTDAICRGDEAVITKTGLIDQIMGDSSNKHIPVYGTPSEYLAANYIQDMRSVMNNFLVAFGIDCSGANVIKRAQNLRDEVFSNNQEIEINREYYLSTRKEAADKCNELFGTSISVDIKQVDTKEKWENGLYESEPSEE